MSHPPVAVVILNWNGLEDTLECLPTVFGNDYPHYSVWIVDNASTEDELQAIREWCHRQNDAPPLHFIQSENNLGFSGGNNLAIRKILDTKAEYVFLLNNDTVVDAHFLSEAVNCAENPSCHTQQPRVGVVATKMVNYYDRSRLDNVGHDLLISGETMPRGRDEHPDQYQQPEEVMGACAGAALYSTQMLKQIGILDEEFFLNYEDSDLSLRAITRGWPVVFCPNAVVYHKISASVNKVKNTPYYVRNQRNQIWAYLHNSPLLVLLLDLPWVLLRELMAILVAIVMLRGTVLWVYLKSRWMLLAQLPRMLKKRWRVMKHKKVSSWWYFRQQKWFLTPYWHYFKKLILRRS